jgi:transcription antitermination factor NusG
MPPSAIPRVTLSQPVKPLDVVAYDEVPGELRLIKLAEVLGIDPASVEAYVRRRQGEPVTRGEVLAERSLLFGLSRRRAIAPIDGVVARLGDGQMIIEGPRRVEEVFASVPGRVVAVAPGRQVVIETTAALIQIAWGIGGLAWGTLRVMDTKPGLDTEANRFTIDHRGAIVAIGSPLTREFLEGAIDIRPKGLIASSMPSSLIPLVQKVNFAVGIVQGFGRVPVSERVLNLLNTYNGREIAMDMAVSADWRDMRPEIIIPVTGQNAPEDRSDDRQDLKVGHKVRVLQEPYFGEIGSVTAIPDELTQLDSGLWVAGAMVQTPSNRTIFVPFANLEDLG